MVAYLKYFTTPKVFTPAAPIAKNLPTETVTIPVKVVTRRAAESRLGVVLPPTQAVTATADLKPSRTGYEALSVIDETTGVSEIIQTEKPEKPLSLPHLFSAGLGLGVSSKTGYTASLEAGYTAVRILGADLSVQARVSKSIIDIADAPEVYGGIRLQKEW